MKKFSPSPVGCCIDKHKKNLGTVKIRFTGLRSGLHDGQSKLQHLEQQQGENVVSIKITPHHEVTTAQRCSPLVVVQGIEVLRLAITQP